MKLKLVKASYENKDKIVEMLEEWKRDIEENNTNHSPWAIFRNDFHDYDSYLANLENKDESNGYVPDSVYFALDEERDIFVGAVNIRHYLNDSLYYDGGHIGDGVRPSERRKGYATEIIKLSLEECKKLGIKKVLLVCDKDNIGSMKSITRNGGVYENDVKDESDGHLQSRYWIQL